MIHLPPNVEYFKNFINKQESAALYQYLVKHYDFYNHKIDTVNGYDHTLDVGKIMFMDQDLFEQNKLPESQWGQTVI